MIWGAYHLSENFGNSGWKVNGKVTFGNSNQQLRSMFWGSPFIPAVTNQTECCLPFTNFSVPSWFQTHTTQIHPFFGFKQYQMWRFCGKLVNGLTLCFRHPNWIFLSNGKHPWTTLYNGQFYWSKSKAQKKSHPVVRDNRFSCATSNF